MRRLKNITCFFYSKFIGARHVQLRHTSPRLLDFAIGLVDSNHHLPDGQVKFFWELKLQNYCRASRSHKGKYVQQSIALRFMPDINA